MSTLTGRCMYIWKIAPIIKTEMSIANLVLKAQQAKLSSVWIKVAEGDSEYANIKGALKSQFIDLRSALAQVNIKTWVWQIPFCATPEDAKK
jgi:hypothetical protein